MRTFKIVKLLMMSIFLALTVEAKVQFCEEAPSFAGAGRDEGLDRTRLPEVVYVARSVEVWMSHKESRLKLSAQHSFRSMKSEVHCSNAPLSKNLNLMSWVPAMIDFSSEKKWGDSLWQMHTLIESNRVGIWTQKSRLAPKDQLQMILQKGTWRTSGAEAYELIWEEVSEGVPLVFRVVFDAMNP